MTVGISNPMCWGFCSIGLSERDVQDYHSQYLRIYDELRPQGKEKDNVNDDLVFEIELIKQVEINIDYILMLIKKYHEGHMEDKEIKVSILKSVDASIELRSKKDLIENFIDSLTPSSNVDEDWKKYVNEQKIYQFNKTDIQDITQKYSRLTDFCPIR